MRTCKSQRNSELQAVPALTKDVFTQLFFTDWPNLRKLWFFDTGKRYNFIFTKMSEFYDKVHPSSLF
ncbi:hypothetical protein L596_000179 [Steinernema carpocapsae]|uniref:Uncharacterized protein n=1 Tax=Steinernema carpocapsae TaxID=34508 RepID=A0A4U8UJT7_STECR|nr:hypothetical protein L596_000179 [Steinernema carpocapsae]